MNTTDEALELDVKIEETGPAARAITITVSAAAVDERAAMAFDLFQGQAQMNGFRKGHAPKALLKKRFGGDLMRETRDRLIGDALRQATTDNNLEMIGEPIFDDEIKDLELVPGEPFVFDFSIEIVPEFVLPSLEGVKIDKPMFKITDEHVTTEITSLCLRNGEPSEVENNFQPLDRLMGVAVVTVEDYEGTFFETDQAAIVVPDEPDEGRGQVLGLLIEDLGKKLEGAKVGDTLTIETVGPDVHEREEVRGKKVSIDFSIKQGVHITPSTPETLAERNGLESAEMLTARIRTGLEMRRDREQRAAEREQVFDYLLSHTEFELPERLSEAQVHRTIERQRMELLYRGMEEDAVELRLAEMRAQAESHAINRLKLTFIMSRIAEDFGIKVENSDIQTRVMEMAAERNVRPEKMLEDLRKNNGLNEVAQLIAEHKAADRIVDQADVTEIDAEAWNKKAQERAAETAEAS